MSIARARWLSLFPVRGLCAGFLVCCLATSSALAQAGLDDVEITSQDLGHGVHMLVGAGGNMGLCVGAEGTFLIDDQFAPLSKKITAKIATLSEQPVKFVVNTHWHGDHTGGNESLGKAGAVIVAHENVRKRMSEGQFMKAFNRRVAPAPPAALPVVTFTSEVTLHLNGETIRVLHVDPAHTDGDSLVFFERARVLHMGDIFFNGLYPFIDAGSGGSIDGVIAAVERALALLEDDVQIIPGHGPLAKKSDLVSYREMLVAVRGKIMALAAEGKSVAEIVAAKPTAAFDAKWGQGFLKPDVWTQLIAEMLHPEGAGSN